MSAGLTACQSIATRDILSEPECHAVLVTESQEP